MKVIRALGLEVHGAPAKGGPSSSCTTDVQMAPHPVGMVPHRVILRLRRLTRAPG
jgi:hypothetical protein